MRRISKLIVSVLIVILGLVFIAACDRNKPTKPVETVEKHLVIYELDDKIYDVSAVVEDENAEEPDLPGESFLGWFIGDIKYNFNTPVTGNVSLKGKWDETKKVAVIYDFNNSELGETTTENYKGFILKKPEEPVLLGYKFNGWHVGDDLYGFSEPLEDDLTLKASWEKKDNLTVEFITDSPVEVASQSVLYMDVANAPEKKTHDGMVLKGWLLENGQAYHFNEPVTEDLTLYADWVDEAVYLDIEDLLNSDIFNQTQQLTLPRKGAVSGSNISWNSSSKYLSKNGTILPLLPGEKEHTAVLTASFRLGGKKTVTHDFFVDIKALDKISLADKKTVDFKNLTTEYSVKSGQMDLFFEEDGYVPYVRITDFFELVKGFIDPDVEFKIVHTENAIILHYQYYDEDEDHTYDLINIIDASANTISTNDPGFFWAYVHTTETNYGRHIEYVYDHPDNYYTDSEDVVYDLNKYNLEITKYNDEILLPFYLVNQLYAGSSYYNVYYNNDGLYGIYSLPRAGETEYTTIKESSKNNEKLPYDLFTHTINTLAFNMDYFFGLKDILEIDTFYNYIFDRKDNLLTTDAQDFDKALFDILVQDLDEPHTSFGYPSYYNNSDWDGPVITMISQFGPRLRDWYNNGIYAVDDVIENKWGRKGIPSNAWAATSEDRPNYWFLDKEHAVITFDSFSTKDIYESDEFDYEIIEDILGVKKGGDLLPKLNNGSKYFFYNTSSTSTKQLELLVKGLNKGDLDTFNSQLKSSGFTHHKESSTTEHKKDGYYSKEVDSKDYFVITTYDEEYGLLYVGVANRVPAKYTSNWPITLSVVDLVEGDSAVYLEMIVEQLLKERSTVTSITLDLTWNMGGNVGALYRVVGFITDQAFKVSRIDRTTSRNSTTHIIVDGVPKYNHINWSLLTSKVTFSAANSLATIFKENNLGPIIGTTSGGGAASITPILLPNGTAFTMSSNNINGYREGLGTEEDPFVYYDNEYGIKPNYPISVYDLYKELVLLNILKNHFED